MQFARIADKKRVDFIIAEVSTFPTGSRILDVGCGNGIISRAVAELGHHVTAIDSSEKTIDAARKTNSHPNIEYKVVLAGELLTEPAKFDVIICSEVLEHLHDPGRLLDILHTSLKEHGSLVVTVPNGNGPRELFVTRPVQYLQRRNNGLTKLVLATKKILGYTGTTVQSSADDLSHVQFFTAGSLRDLAAGHSFFIRSISKTNFIEQVFPFSLLAKRSAFLQKMDCELADRLPLGFTSGFMSVWKKVKKN